MKDFRKRGITQKSIYRIVDANFNRTKEGLRVCEDICRFVLNRPDETKIYKSIRHRLTGIITQLKLTDIVAARDMKGDVGKVSTAVELKRTKPADIFYANSQRAKESLRVLEEFLKLLDKKSAQKLKAMRYEIYAVEQKIVKRL